MNDIKRKLYLLIWIIIRVIGRLTVAILQLYSCRYVTILNKFHWRMSSYYNFKETEIFQTPKSSYEGALRKWGHIIAVKRKGRVRSMSKCIDQTLTFCEAWIHSRRSVNPRGFDKKRELQFWRRDRQSQAGDTYSITSLAYIPRRFLIFILFFTYSHPFSWV